MRKVKEKTVVPTKTEYMTKWVLSRKTRYVVGIFSFMLVWVMPLMSFRYVATTVESIILWGMIVPMILILVSFGIAMRTVSEEDVAKNPEKYVAG